MVCWLKLIVETLGAGLRDRRALVLENLALRQQLMVLASSGTKPRFSELDRFFWVVYSRFVDGWQRILHVARPCTVIDWQKRRFRRFWARKGRGRTAGRPKIKLEIRKLIQTMSQANPTWGTPRFVGELGKLGISVCKATVDRYRIRSKGPPSQTWRSFLGNEAKAITGIDFFTVPTASFRILYVFIVLMHARRQVVHFNVTEHPTASWTAQQIVEAFPWDSAPRHLIRDNDGIYGAEFCARLEGMGITETRTAFRSPWQNPCCERIIGSIRRDCLHHVIIFNEAHLRRILESYFDYNHRCRTHLSLDKDCPEPRATEPPENGKVIAIPQVGGLHNLYARKAA